MLLGSLASLLESLPARSVRLVVFNLDQQREVFRQDDLMPESFPQVAQAMNDLQLQLVDYRTLENQRGHIDLVAALVNQEIHSESTSDAVFFLGPPSRYLDKLPQSVFGEPGEMPPQFFFFQYKPYWRRAAELPGNRGAFHSAPRCATIVSRPIQHGRSQMRRFGSDGQC